MLNYFWAFSAKIFGSDQFRIFNVNSPLQIPPTLVKPFLHEVQVLASLHDLQLGGQAEKHSFCH